MTTDELLAKLNTEVLQITSELPKVYEAYGRVAYKKLVTPSILDPCGSYWDGRCYERGEIERRHDRQKELWDLTAAIGREARK